MSPRIHRTALQSAVLATAISLTASAVRKPEVDPIVEKQFVQAQTSQILQANRGKTAKQILVDELRPKMVQFPIQKGDFPASLAAKHGLNVDEFIILNEILGAPSFSRGRKVPLLRIGEPYYAPVDISLIRPFFAKMHRVEKAERIQSALDSGDSFKKVHSISRETFFPKEPECLGLGEVLSSMLAMQQDEFDPLLPVIVDPRNEKTASCANLIKNTFIQTCNLKHYTAKQKKMLLTTDLHAWILVKKLRDEFGFNQSFADLMEAFDLNNFYSFNPIVNPEKRTRYESRIRDLFEYLQTEAPQGTIVPMYFQGSLSKGAVMGAYSPKDPHLNTHQTMFAGNIDWKLRASDIPRIQDGKRIPFGFDPSKITQGVAEVSQQRDILEKNLEIAKKQLLTALDPTINETLVGKLNSVLWTMEVALRDPKLSQYLASLPLDKRQEIPVGVYSQSKIATEVFADFLRKKVRSELIDGTLTVSLLQKYFGWYAFKAGDLPFYQSYFEHASILAARRKELALALEKQDKPLRLDEFGSTIATNKEVAKAFEAYSKYQSQLFALKNTLSDIQKKAATSNDISRSVVDTMVDFIAGRADFRSSFLPQFRNTVLQGMQRYPDMIQIQVNGKKIDFGNELEAHRTGKTGTLLRPNDEIHLVGPMMLDGEIQPTSDFPERRDRMNARTRFFYEFVATIYLPTEVLTPREGVLPERNDVIPLQSGLQQRYVYSLRRGDTLASVLKNRIARYEGISDSDPKRDSKISEHFAWQIRALKMDGFLQTESEFNPGAVNENRIIPYYDVRTVPDVWKKYLSERKTAELEYERDISLPYLRIFTLDGGGIDSKRKIFSEIRERILASSTRLAQFPILKSIEQFNEFQYEMFMKRFFERSVNDAGVDTSVAFFRDIRPNRSFYIGYQELAEIIGEISDATALETPQLKLLDEKVIDGVISNKHNASLAKNILVTESYPTDGGTGVRKLLKRIGGRSRGDYQLRFVELTENPVFIRDDALFVIGRNGVETRVEWPTIQHLREAVTVVFQEDVSKLAKENLSASAYSIFKQDALKLADLRQKFASHTLSPEETKKAIKEMMELVRIDPGNGSNLVGKIFTTSLLNAKISLHYRKTTYWLEQIGIPFDILANSEEERSKYERTVALVNNLSEEKVLLALLENAVIRLMRDAVGMQFTTRDVYAKPKNPLKKVYQEVAGQIYYDRSLFFSHLDDYISKAKYSIKMTELDLIETTHGEKQRAILARQRALILHLENYANLLRNSRNFNATVFDFFKDPITQSFLVEAKLPITPFPTIQEITEADPFRASIFNYIAKMERRITREKKAGEGTINTQKKSNNTAA